MDRHCHIWHKEECKNCDLSSAGGSSWVTWNNPEANTSLSKYVAFFTLFSTAQVEGVPTVIGGESASFSEQLVNGSWHQHVIHTPAVMIASVMVDPLDFHC